MSKIISLHAIIQAMSGNSDNRFVSGICHKVQGEGYCDGIRCEDCPFDGADRLDKLAIELDEKQIVSEEAIQHLHDNHPEAYKEFYDKL